MSTEPDPVAIGTPFNFIKGITPDTRIGTPFNFIKGITPSTRIGTPLNYNQAERFPFGFVRMKQLRANAPMPLHVFSISELPDATQFTHGDHIFVSDETGGSIPAFSDGTNWLRVTDRAVVS